MVAPEETAVKRLARRVSTAVGIAHSGRPSVQALMGSPASEESIGQRFARCGEHGLLKVSIGSVVGAAAALLLFKGRGMRMAMVGFGAGCGAGSAFTACNSSFKAAAAATTKSRQERGSEVPAKEDGGNGEGAERLHTASAGATEMARDVDTKPVPKKKNRTPHGRP